MITPLKLVSSDSPDLLQKAIDYLEKPIKETLNYSYNSLFKEQGGICKICNLPPSNGKKFAKDHDHKCCTVGRGCKKCIRGLLCSNCNTGLGQFNDNTDTLRKAIIYIEKYKSSILVNNNINLNNTVYTYPIFLIN